MDGDITNTIRVCVCALISSLADGGMGGQAVAPIALASLPACLCTHPEITGKQNELERGNEGRIWETGVVHFWSQKVHDTVDTVRMRKKASFRSPT